MMADTSSGVEPSPVQNITAGYSKIQRQYQQVLDRWTPYMLYRWLGTAGLLALFMLRIVLAQGVSVFLPSRFSYDPDATFSSGILVSMKQHNFSFTYQKFLL